MCAHTCCGASLAIELHSTERLCKNFTHFPISGLQPNQPWKLPLPQAQAVDRPGPGKGSPCSHSLKTVRTKNAIFISQAPFCHHGAVLAFGVDGSYSPSDHGFRRRCCRRREGYGRARRPQQLLHYPTTLGAHQFRAKIRVPPDQGFQHVRQHVPRNPAQSGQVRTQGVGVLHHRLRHIYGHLRYVLLHLG